jgi:hypothetical protein
MLKRGTTPKNIALSSMYAPCLTTLVHHDDQVFQIQVDNVAFMNFDHCLDSQVFQISS